MRFVEGYGQSIPAGGRLLATHSGAGWNASGLTSFSIMSQEAAGALVDILIAGIVAWSG